MLSKIETLEALQTIAMAQKDYADTLKRFETYTGIQFVGRYDRNELHVMSGLVESGVDLKQTAKTTKEYPTAYSIDIDGIRFFELSKDEMREDETK